MNRQQRRAKAAVSRAAAHNRSADRRHDGNAPRALAGPPASPTTPPPAEPANDLDGRGLGRLVIDPTQADRQQEMIAMDHVSPNNRITPHLEAHPPALGSSVGGGGPGGVESAPPIIEGVSSDVGVHGPKWLKSRASSKYTGRSRVFRVLCCSPNALFSWDFDP